MTLGIDIGGSSVKAALRTGASAETAVSDPYERPDRAALAAAVRDAVGRLEPSGVARVGRVGLCVPGRPAPDGRSIGLSFNVPGLVGYPFAEIVGEALGRSVPVVRLSDAEAATIDAARAHPDARRVLGIAVGTGVGAALVESGVPARIGSGPIGHLGQIDVGPIGGESRVGSDGGRDSLEAYLGLPALRARFGGELETRLGDIGPEDPALVALSRAVRIALAVYTPDLVLVLGGVGLAMSPQASGLEAVVRDGLTSIAPQGWRLAFGTTRFHAALGAAERAAEAAGA